MMMPKPMSCHRQEPHDESCAMASKQYKWKSKPAFALGVVTHCMPWRCYGDPKSKYALDWNGFGIGMGLGLDWILDWNGNGFWIGMDFGLGWILDGLE